MSNYTVHIDCDGEGYCLSAQGLAGMRAQLAQANRYSQAGGPLTAWIHEFESDCNDCECHRDTPSHTAHIGPRGAVVIERHR
jgi:hypothetical protein